MADQTATTVPAKPPTAEELEAAITGQQPAQQQTVSTKKFRYEINPTTVYEADTAEEALEKLVQAQKNATEHITRIHEENKQLRDFYNQQTLPPRDAQGRFTKAEEPAQTGGQFDQNRYFQLFTENPAAANAYLLKHQGGDVIMEVLADRLGIPTEQLVPTFSKTVQASQLVEDNAVAAAFANECPDFPFGDAKAIDSLMNAVNEMGGVFTPKSMKAAHHMCIAEKRYESVPVQSGVTERVTPMPMPKAGGTTDIPNPFMEAERMDTAELRKFIESAAAKGILK